MKFSHLSLFHCLYNFTTTRYQQLLPIEQEQEVTSFARVRMTCRSISFEAGSSLSLQISVHDSFVACWMHSSGLRCITLDAAGASSIVEEDAATVTPLPEELLKPTAATLALTRLIVDMRDPSW